MRFSRGIILLIFFLFATNVSAQVLFFEPDEISLGVGEIFPVKVFINSENKIINVVSAQIKFDPEKIKIEQISFGGSVFPIIPTNPDISNYEKTASFTGAKPNGFSSKKALVAQIDIKPIAQGASEIYFSDDTKVYLNDGLGTEIKANGGRLKIKAVQAAPKSKIIISSTTHSDQSRWYNSKNAAVFWQTNAGADYSYEVNSDYFFEPDNKPDLPTGLITLKNLPEGISYFHLKECSPEGNCGEKSTFRLQIDTVAPQYETAFFELEGQEFLSIIAQDENSGVDKIERLTFKEVSRDERVLSGVIGQGKWQKALMPYLLAKSDKDSALIFKITDKAGNYQTVKIPLVRKNYFMIGLFTALIAALVIYILFKIKIKRNPPSAPPTARTRDEHQGEKKSPLLEKDNSSDIIGQMGKGVSLVLLVLFLYSFGHFVFAQSIPEPDYGGAPPASNWRILFDGKLTDADGRPVADGNYNARFAIFDAEEEGSEVWLEIFEKDNRIKVLEGNFQAMLGQVSPIDLDFNKGDFYLSVSIGGSDETPVWDKEMKPRRKIITLEKLLSGEELILSESELIDALIKEFESLDAGGTLRPDRSAAAFIEFIKNKLKAPDGSTIIVNLNTLQKILEKAAVISQVKETKAAEAGGGFLEFFIRIINTLIEKIAQIFEKIGQIFTYLINISDKVDKIYDIVSKPNANQAVSPEGHEAVGGEFSMNALTTQAFGSGSVEKNSSSLFVEAPQVDNSSKIFITFKRSPPFVWWISQKLAGQGFYISLYPQAADNISFDWWIVNNLNFKESPLPSPSELPQNQNNEQTQSPPVAQTPTAETPQEQQPEEPQPQDTNTLTQPQ